MMSSRRFLTVVCRYSPLLRYVFQFVVVLVLLSLFSIPFVRQGTPSYYILILNFVFLTPLLMISGVLVHVCKEHKQRKTVDAVEEATAGAIDRDR